MAAANARFRRHATPRRGAAIALCAWLAAISGLTPSSDARAASAEWWRNRPPVVNGPSATVIRQGPVHIHAIDGKESKWGDRDRIKVPAGRRHIDLCVWALWTKTPKPKYLPLCSQNVEEKNRQPGDRVLVQTGGPFPDQDRPFRDGLTIRPRQAVFDFAAGGVYRITAELLANPWSFREDGWRVRLERQRRKPDGRIVWETLFGAVRAPALEEIFPPYARREQPLPLGWRPFPPRPGNPYRTPLNADGTPLGADGTLEGITGRIGFNAQPVPSSGDPSTAPVRKADLPIVSPPYWLVPPARTTSGPSARADGRAAPVPTIGNSALADAAPPPFPAYADGSPLGGDGTLEGLRAGDLAGTPTGKLTLYHRPGDDPRYADGTPLGADGALEGIPETLVFAALPDTAPPAAVEKGNGAASAGETAESRVSAKPGNAPDRPAAAKVGNAAAISPLSADGKGEDKDKAKPGSEVVSAVEAESADPPVTPGIEVPPDPVFTAKDGPETTAHSRLGKAD